MKDEEYIESLRLASLVTEPAISQVIEKLAIPKGSTGLDVGCGTALRTILLAEKSGQNGRIIGLDNSPGNLEAAVDTVRQSPLAEQINLVQGNLLELPFRDASFDWVWCADTLWPGNVVTNPIEAIRGFAETLRPGGILALVYWSSQVFLPGHPALEARLNKAFAETTRYLCGVSPGNHYLRALRWLQAADLQNLSVHSFLAEVIAPLDEQMRKAVAYCFEMFWGDLKSHVSEEDWREYRLLCDPDSKDFILNRPDYYAFLSYTLFKGTTPQ